MKKIRNGILFVFTSLLICACFSPLEFPTTPQIEFNKVEFIDVSDVSSPDLLVLYVDFNDGDGDLGLANEVLDSPYHVKNFFLGKNGQVTRISSRTSVVNDPSRKKYDLSRLKYASNQKSPKNISYILGYMPVNSGRLITSNEKNNPRYNSILPANEPPYTTCTANLKAYLEDTIFVEKKFKYALDNATIVDHLLSPTQEIVYYAVLGKWYLESNDASFNITVQFQIKSNTDGSFYDYDWRKETCTTFDGRFPVLSERALRPIDGTLQYSMASVGFLPLFRQKTLRLKVQIQDRNLTKSNVIITNQFILQ